MLKKLLGFSKEPLELDISEAEEKFKEYKQKEMEQLDQKAESLQSDIKEAVEQLKRDLTDLKDFEDSQDRQVINDVVDNIVSDRYELINNLSLPENPEDLYKELNEFITEFEDLKRKEEAVLEEAYLDKELSRSINSLENQRQKLSEFLDGEYRVYDRFEKLKQLSDERKTLLNDKEEIKKEIDQEIHRDQLKTRKQELEEKLRNLKKSQKWKDFKELKERHEKKKMEKNGVISDINTTVNRMERGLKKVIYEAENGELSLDETDVLENLRDKKTSKILENPEETARIVEDVVEILPDNLLNDKQQQKFVEAAEELETLPEKSEKLDELSSEIESLSQKIENHEAVEKEEKLESRIDDLKRQLEDTIDQENKLEEKVEELEYEIKELEKQIKKILDDSLNRDIKFSN